MSGKKILIVDDDREAADFLEKGLLRQGFEVIKAYDGLQAQKVIDAALRSHECGEWIAL